MVKNFQNFVWVFRPDIIPDLKAKVENLIDAGFAFAAKTHDGDPADDGEYFLNNYHLMDSLIGRRVPLYAWGYNYGDKYGNLQQEIDAAVKSVRLADGYIFDPEIEFEQSGSSEWVHAMVPPVLAAAAKEDKPVGYAPFWNRRWHGAYPYKAFDQYPIFAMPQVYYDLGQKTTTKSRTDMFAISYEDFPLNFYPVSGVQSIEGMMHFQRMVREYVVPSYSIWCLDTMTQEQIDYFLLLSKIQKVDDGFSKYKKVYDAWESLFKLF